MPTPSTSFDKLPDFEKGFFTAAFWDGDGEIDYRDSGKNSELWERLHPINKETLLYALHNWKMENEDLLAVAGDDKQNGHDLWLTQSGHGCGFWDRGYGEIGHKLSEKSREFGPYGCSINADGVFIQPNTLDKCTKELLTLTGSLDNPSLKTPSDKKEKSGEEQLLEGALSGDPDLLLTGALKCLKQGNLFSTLNKNRDAITNFIQGENLPNNPKENKTLDNQRNKESLADNLSDAMLGLKPKNKEGEQLQHLVTNDSEGLEAFFKTNLEKEPENDQYLDKVSNLLGYKLTDLKKPDTNLEDDIKDIFKMAGKQAIDKTAKSKGMESRPASQLVDMADDCFDSLEKDFDEGNPPNKKQDTDKGKHKKTSGDILCDSLKKTKNVAAKVLGEAVKTLPGGIFLSAIIKLVDVVTDVIADESKKELKGLSAPFQDQNGFMKKTFDKTKKLIVNEMVPSKSGQIAEGAGKALGNEMKNTPTADPMHSQGVNGPY